MLAVSDLAYELATPARFARRYCPDFAFPAHVQAFQRATLDLIYNPDIHRQIIEAPVRHGKSYWHSIIVPAWFCCAFPSKKALGVSYGSSLSDTFARDVVRICEAAGSDLGYCMAFKRADSFRWSDFGGGYDSCGAEGSLSGKGYHFIAADDLVKDDAAARSPTQRESLSKWFAADCLTRVEPGGKISLVMSRRHMSDLSGEALAVNAEAPPEKYWHSVKFTAIDGDGNALWPQRYSIEALRAIQREFELKGMSYQFSSLYQQDPRSDPAACEWPDDYFGSHLFYEELPPGINPRLRLMAIDPSKGAQSKSGDYCAIHKIILDWDNTLWVDAHLQRMTPTAVISNAAGMIALWKPDATIIETQGFQEQLSNDIRAKLDTSEYRGPLYPFDSHEQKEVRIRLALSEYLHRHKLRFKDTKGGRLTVNQMKEFPSGEHDDGPDALAMGVTLIGEVLGL